MYPLVSFLQENARTRPIIRMLCPDDALISANKINVPTA